MNELENLKYYMHYFIKMTYLNSLIPPSVSKHPIVSFEDFKNENMPVNYPYKSRLIEFKEKFTDCEFIA